MPCPLCESIQVTFFHRDKRREFLRCEQCALVFVPDTFLLSAAQEKSEYDLHDNRVDDPRYRGFLSRVFEPICERVPVPAKGLEFGCGPGPALAAMFVEAGYEVSLYDLYYANEPKVLTEKYDFITCTEVVEHLYKPGLVLAQMIAMLKSGGWLGLMTQMVIDLEAFKGWCYKNDQTHVSFFSQETFQWLAQKYQLDLVFLGRDVILLQQITTTVLQESTRKAEDC